jgi:FkbM family methyltransferase
MRAAERPTDERARLKSERASRKAEIAAREAFFAEARELTPFLAVSVGEELFFVASDDQGVGRRVFVRSWRKDMTTVGKAVDRLAEFGVQMPADPVFVDVGANIGTTTVMALRRHPFSSAVALEPSPGNFRLLRINLVANGLDTVVRALPIAAADEEGQLVLDTSRSNRGGHRVRTELAVGASEDDESSIETVTVESVTLDGLVDRGVIEPARVGLLWIDTAGSEAKTLLGATQLVRAGVPIALAIRPGQIEAGSTLADLLTAHYTDVAELRKGERLLPIGELTNLAASYQHKGDVLLVRR